MLFKTLARLEWYVKNLVRVVDVAREGGAHAEWLRAYGLTLGPTASPPRKQTVVL